MKTDSANLFRRKWNEQDRDTEDRLTAEMRIKVRELAKDVHDVIDMARTEEFADLLAGLADRADDIQRLLIAWVELIELLVDDCERRDTRSGRGKQKKLEVKSTMNYILRIEIDIPNVPEYVEAIVIDVVVDWTIDALVCLVNDNDHFAEAGKRQPSWLERVRNWAVQVVWDFLGLFAPLIGWIQNRINYVHVPRPRLRAAADKVIDAGFAFDIQDSVSGVMQLTTFVGHNREGITALVRIVSGAIKEAQFLKEKTNPEKKAYAVRLIMATLDELDLSPQLPFLKALLPFFVDFMIEASYRVLKKRVFSA